MFIICDFGELRLIYTLLIVDDGHVDGIWRRILVVEVARPGHLRTFEVQFIAEVLVASAGAERPRDPLVGILNVHFHRWLVQKLWLELLGLLFKHIENLSSVFI